uniref:CCAAT/enhancer-binding protein zeta n=1 Tax=Nothobranchius kuhntae TaxID=321403 RepID=A0A1A8KF65_NOTKU
MAARNQRRRKSGPVRAEGEDLQEEWGSDEELNQEEVFRLGGTQADIVLIAGINDSRELVDGGMKGAIDDLEEGELESFITKLGIRAYAGEQSIPDEPSENMAAGKVEGQNVSTEEQASSGLRQEVKQKKDRDVPAVTGKKSRQNISVYEFQPRQVLLIKPGGKWFHMEYAAEETSAPQDPVLVSRYKSLAQQLFEAEVALYRSKKNLQKGANSAWMKSVVSAGVLADRMAAMTVLIQDAPVHMLEHVETLVSMMKRKGGRRMGLMALDTLRELLLTNLLPENRKLRPFIQHPFDNLEEKASGNRDARDRRLILWYFEHLLKLHVAEFVSALDGMTHDTVMATKTKALGVAYELLSRQPEQERVLLAQVVNKLGDPDYKMATKASHMLETLLHRHPNMKTVVCCEVERLMFRPNIGTKAQYYAICFLSQVVLSHDEAALAAKLIAIYFSFFRSCVKKKDVESKMLSALLSGVNRAYPYAGAGDEKVKEQLDTLFRVVHLAKFNTAVQALMLLFQVLDSQQSVSDRFYVALYRKLLDPGLSTSSSQNMFLNLLFKSMKVDVLPRRVKAFSKRLLQVGAQQSPAFACGALFLLSELIRAKPGLRDLLQEGGEGEDEEEEFKDLKEEEEEENEEEGGARIKPAASWVHHQNMEGGRTSQNYDPLHRNPLFCGADHSSFWELHQFSLHFHPSVALFARTILQAEPIQYSGDPLQDFTLIRFLDRFVFRNPKQQKGKQNSDSAVLRPKLRFLPGSVPVNCADFLSKEESQVPVDQVFFHRFFKKRQQDKQNQRPERGGDDESVEDVDDEEFENLLDSLEGDSYFTDVEKEDLDFAANVKSKRTQKNPDSDSDLSDLDDEEVSLGSMDEEDFGDVLEEEEGGTFMDPSGDEEDEAPELEEEEEEDEDLDPPVRKRRSNDLSFCPASGSATRTKKPKREASMFASAEEFGSLLDENTDAKFDHMGLNAMATKDRAGLKQLKWESQRDDWIHNRDATTLRRKKSRGKRHGQGQTGNRKFRHKKK